MEFRPNRKAKDLIGDMIRANELMEEQKWPDAREIFLRGRSFARELGLPHANVSWGLCVCLDNMGQLEEAFRMALEAVDQQPLDPSMRRSLRIVSRRLGECIEARTGDPANLIRYELLVQNDAAETSTHVAMARHYLQVGDQVAAAELLESLTTLVPNCAEAWRLRSQLAKTQGEDGEAAKMEIEAIACEGAIAAAVETKVPATRTSDSPLGISRASAR